MTNLEWPRGFVLGKDAIERPIGFVDGPVLPNFYVHPNSDIDFAEGDAHGDFVIVIGSCADLNEGREPVAKMLLERLSVGEEAFYEALDWLVGRYAIIFSSSSNVQVVGDATAMRPAFYTEGGGTIASHARLLAGLEGLENSAEHLPFSSSFPANYTPYSGVRVLPPNFLLDLETGHLKRFWPREEIAPRSTEKAAHEVLDLATRAFDVLSQGRESWLALTAGLDSRVSLAVALNAGVDIKTFTYGTAADTRMDRKVAWHLASRFGLEHVELQTRTPDKDLKNALEEAHYWNHHRVAVAPIAEVVDNVDSAVFSSNVLEIGQSNYRKLQWRAGLDEPKTADQMAAVYYRKLSKSTRKTVEEYGRSKYLKDVANLFQRYLDETGGPSPFLDPFDDYYWTFRMGAWHGPSSLEKDFYGEPLNPYNCRNVIVPLISVSKYDQYDVSVFMRLITLVDASLLDVPINPTDLSWL